MNNNQFVLAADGWVQVTPCGEYLRKVAEGSPLDWSSDDADYEAAWRRARREGGPGYGLENRLKGRMNAEETVMSASSLRCSTSGSTRSTRGISTRPARRRNTWPNFRRCSATS